MWWNTLYTACILSVVSASILANTRLANELGDCPPGVPRTQFVQSFGEVCLQFVNHGVSGNGANSQCHHHGGHLVMIKDQEKQKFIVDRLRALHWSDDGVWIGATDQEQEGNWKWVDGSTVTYGNWHPGEGPSHGFFFSKAFYEDCALIRLDDGGRWHDYDCRTILYHHSYICEYKKIYRSMSSTTVSVMPKSDVPTTHESFTDRNTTARPSDSLSRMTTLFRVTSSSHTTTQKTTLSSTTTTLPPTTTTFPPTTTTLPPTTTTLAPTTTTLPTTTTTLPTTTTTLPTTTTTLPTTTTSTTPPTTTTTPPTTTTTLPTTTTTLPPTTTTLPPTTTSTTPPTTTTTLPPTTTKRPTTTTALPTSTTQVKTTTIPTSKPTTTFGGIHIEFGTTPHAKKRKAERAGLEQSDSDGDHSVTYIALGAGSGVIVVLVAAVLAILIRKRRRHQTPYSTIRITSTQENPIYDIMKDSSVA